MKQIPERNLNKNNKTPLHYAAEKNSIKIVELLISKGADINAIDIIYQIIAKSFLIIMKQIKEKYLNKNNETPLHFAAQYDSNKIGELFISKGADINAKKYYLSNYFKSFLIILKQIKEKNFNLNNRTLFQIAIENDSHKIGELLISKGADINAKNIIYQIIINHF